MTVSKTFVAKVLRDEGYRLAGIRRRIKNRRPRPMPRNLIWGMDLTFRAKSQPPILGLIDRGTRACVALREIPSKASLEILQIVLDTCRKLGKPTAVRTDNEPVFTSRLFRFGLWLLGIRHQRTAPFAPWQNGRIERLFGTLKETLRQRDSEPENAQRELDVFRCWYNHVRPHQHLGGLTPAMAREGTGNRKRRKEPLYFNEWERVLTGFYLS